MGGGRSLGSGSVNIVRRYWKCKGSINREYDREIGLGFSSALFWGAAWSSSEPATTQFITGLGIAVHFWSRCKVLIVQDVIIGDCCD